MKEIEVRLHVKDMPVGVLEYFEWVERECRKAGIPFSDGEPENGVLFRRDYLDDPGYTTWVYRPNAQNL